MQLRACELCSGVGEVDDDLCPRCLGGGQYLVLNEDTPRDAPLLGDVKVPLYG